MVTGHGRRSRAVKEKKKRYSVIEEQEKPSMRATAMLQGVSAPGERAEDHQPVALAERRVRLDMAALAHVNDKGFGIVNKGKK